MTARALRVPLAAAAAVVLVDQLSKHWALDALAGGHTIDLVGSLRFNLAFNEGMAFSQGTGLGPVIAAVAVAVVVILLVSVGRSTSRVYPVAVGLIVGGALGNLTDRLFRGQGWFRGAVVDFIDLQWWPIFNVADICVSVGGGLLLLSSLLTPATGERAHPRRRPGHDEHEAGEANPADRPDPPERWADGPVER